MRHVPFAIILISGLAILSCRTSFKLRAPVPKTSHDSLRVTVSSSNLSERMSGDDEILILCYLYPDSAKLGAPLFIRKLKINSKNLSRQFQCRVGNSKINQRMLLFLLEQDEERPASNIDSTLRVSHRAIAKEFSTRNYTGIEKYLGDEDVLAIKVIPKIDCDNPNIFLFNGIYKLDKFEYQVKIQCR